MYSDAAQACSAITERLSMSSGHGPFFFGAKPCSFDALLYGLLAFQQASPVTSPEMKQQVGLVSLVALHLSKQLTTWGLKPAEQLCSMTDAAAVLLGSLCSLVCEAAGGTAGHLILQPELMLKSARLVGSMLLPARTTRTCTVMLQPRAGAHSHRAVLRAAASWPGRQMMYDWSVPACLTY